MKNPLVLFISPHLDDAVISCGVRIIKERALGRRVLVATVFSSGGTAQESSQVYEMRRAEDQHALSLLGAEAIWLDFIDAPFRLSFYTSFRQIILVEHPADRDLIPEVTRAIDGLAKELNPERIFLPLAVGTHIDHRLTFQAAYPMAKTHKITFYEDRPYVFVRGSLRQRFLELGFTCALPGLDDLSPKNNKDLVHELCQSLGTIGYCMRYLPPGPERLSCALRLARRFRRPAAKASLALAAELVQASSEEFSKLAAAVSAYQSQVPELFGAGAGFKKEALDYSRLLRQEGTYCERYWDVKES